MSLLLAPYMITSKFPLPPSESYKYENYVKTAYKSFSLLLNPTGKPDHQALHCTTANFGRISRGSVTKPMLTTVFDTYRRQGHQEPGFESRPFRF